MRPSLSHPRSAEAAARTPSRLETAAHTPSRDEAASPIPSDAAFRTPNYAEAAVATLDGTDDEDLISDDSSDDNKILGYKGGGITRPPSPDLSEYSITNAEVTKFAFVERLRHYMAGALIGLYNRSAVEACIFMEVGTAIRDLDTMKVPQMEDMFSANTWLSCDPFPLTDSLTRVCKIVCWNGTRVLRRSTLVGVCSVSIKLTLQKSGSLVSIFQG